MSYRQQGYGSAGRVARKSDRDITSLQEIRARQVTEPNTNFSSNASSAVGMPGYYSSQRGPAVTKAVYRRLAALGAQNGFGGDNDADAKKAFYAAQGIMVGSGTGEVSEATAENMAMLKWKDRKQFEGFGVKLERDDVEFLEQKRAEELQFQFDQWLVRRVDLDDPANQRWVQEMVPEFYERREKFIDDKINLEAALAKIKLRGVKDKKDLQLLFALNSGLIQPSTQPLFKSTGLTAGTDYQAGMMSVLQWFAPRDKGPSNGAASNADTGPFAQPHHIHGVGGGVL